MFQACIGALSEWVLATPFSSDFVTVAPEDRIRTFGRRQFQELSDIAALSTRTPAWSKWIVTYDANLGFMLPGHASCEDLQVMDAPWLPFVHVRLAPSLLLFSVMGRNHIC